MSPANTPTHTPGPWKVAHRGHDKYGDHLDSIWGADYQVAAVLIASTQKENIAAADADLMSMAPELLEGCRVAGLFILLTAGNEPDGEKYRAVKALADRLAELVARAEGR